MQEFKDNASLKSDAFMWTIELIVITKQYSAFMCQTLCPSDL